MERNDVALRKKPVLVGVLKTDVRCRFFVGVWVICKHVHSEALAYPDENLTYLTRADNACVLAVEVKAREAVYAEIEVPCADIGFVNLAVQKQEKCHCVLRYGIGGICGHPENGEPSRSVFQVDVVISRTAHKQELYPTLCQLLDDPCIKAVIHECAYSLAAVGKGYCFGGKLIFKITDIKAFVCLVKMLPVIGLCVIKCDPFHNITAFLILYSEHSACTYSLLENIDMEMNVNIPYEYSIAYANRANVDFL